MDKSTTTPPSQLLGEPDEGGGVGDGGLPYDGVAYSLSLHAKESAVSCGWVGHLAPVQTQPLFLYMYNS